MMWVKANLNFHRFKQGKVYEIAETRVSLSLAEAGYFLVYRNGEFIRRYPMKEVTDGTGEVGQDAENPSGTTGGGTVGDEDSSSDSDGGEEAGTEG